MAAEYQGKNIDGIKLPGKAYFSDTGGSYNVMVSFNRNRATIYFEDGGQTTIQLRQNAITDTNDIEGFGEIGQYYLGRSFSIGLVNGDNSIGTFGATGSRGLQGFWIISLNKKDLMNTVSSSAESIKPSGSHSSR
jgi:hypothetical protein